MKPILFNDEMVRAILDGRKTQTRRVVKPQPAYPDAWETPMFNRPQFSCPLGQPGDRMWVREAWGVAESRFAPRGCTIRYRADDATFEVVGESGLKYAGKDMSFRWRPSIHMPRWASRLTLEITDVRVQRLQEISEEDAQAEGVQWNDGGPFNNGLPTTMIVKARDEFRHLWDSVDKPGVKWEANPWVWAISFKRVEA